MKIWIVIFIASLFLFIEAAPLIAIELDLNGDYRVRGFSTQNLSDANDDIEDDTAYYASRFILNAIAEKDNIKGVTTILLGHDGNTGNRLLGNDPYGPTNGGATNFFGLLQAYLQADLGQTELTVGRQMVVLGHSVIHDDPMDAIRFSREFAGMNFALTIAKLVERSDAPGIGNSSDGTGTTKDADLYSLEVKGGEKDGLSWNAFLALLNDRGGNLYGIPGDTEQFELNILGIALDMPFGSINTSAEIDFLTGTVTNTVAGNNDVSGLNIVLGGGTELSFAKVGVLLVYTSGQDSNEIPSAGGDVNANGINGNYPVGIIITNIGAESRAPKDGQCLSIDGASLGGGAPGCIGGSGLTALKVSGTKEVMDKTMLDVAAIWAQASEDNAAGENAIGIELDVVAKYSVTDFFHFLGGVGYLMTGDFFGTDSDNKVVLVTEAQFTF